MAERHKKTPWEMRLAAMEAAQERSRQELEEYATANVQFVARSMQMEGLMEEAEVAVLSRNGELMRRERRKVVLVVGIYEFGLHLGRDYYVDASGRAFVGRREDSSERSLGDIVELSDVPTGWYGDNVGKVHAARARRISQVRARQLRSTVVRPQ